MSVPPSGRKRYRDFAHILDEVTKDLIGDGVPASW
jgi:hypothetical protein